MSNMKKITGFFDSGYKPNRKIFEKKQLPSRLNFDNPEYHPLINQPNFYYTQKLYKKEIPLKIFQTWGTKKLPENMLKCVETLKNTNPEFEYFLFDDEDCENFINEHFNSDVLEAYRKLVPGAFKADLWRYCVLYVHGGIYLDIKYQPFKGFKLIELTESEHYVLDLPESGGGIYNALMVAKPCNPKLLAAINRVVSNVKNEYYGSSSLEPTGPMLLKPIFYNDPTVDLSLSVKWDMISIIRDKKVILYGYKEYRSEQSKFYRKNKTNHYFTLWLNREIYSKLS